MTVTIFGATGMVGRQLVTHCLAKGWQVRAFGRNADQLMDAEERNPLLTAVKGYVFDEMDVRQAVRGANAVLSALGGAIEGTDKTRSLGIKNIIGQMQATGVRRIIALGGLGVLAGPDGHYLLESPDYPQQYLAVGLEHKQAYEYLRESHLDWTFVCAPNILPADANNHYQAASEKPGPSLEINAGNLALFMVEELEQRAYLHQRAGIGNT